MNFSREDIDNVIVKYLHGEATSEEIQLLREYINSSPENLNDFKEKYAVWSTYGALDIENKVSSERALSKVLSTVNKKQRIGKILIRVAATLFIPLLLINAWLILQNKHVFSTKTVAYNEITASFGTRSLVTLADGSTVWLNAGSKLKYPHQFVGRERIVYLEGEALFNVESNKKNPFIVKTNNLSVEATGTRFDVLAYANEARHRVILVEGNVGVFHWDEQKGVSNHITNLSPNHVFSFDTLTRESELSSEDIYKYIAWTEGKLVFRDDPMSEVIKKISHFYNVDIELKGEQLKDYIFRATFDEESIDEILKLLKLSSPIEYYEVTRKPLPDGSFPKRKIIITARKN